jgi:hypothetical protein
MKGHSTDDRIWGIGLLLCAIVIGGCSLSTSSSKEEAVEVTLTNNTNTTIVYQAFAFIDTDVDPRPFKVDLEKDQLVSPQETRVLTNKIITKKEGHFTSNDSIRVFVWEVAGDSAYIKQNLTYAADKLKQKDYAIEIEEFNSTCTEASIDQQSPEEQKALFEYVPDLGLSEEQAHHYSLIWNQLYTTEVAIVRLANNADSLLRNGEAIQLNLPHEQYLTVTNNWMKHNESGSTSWSGAFQNIHGSVILVYKKGDITGTINPGAVTGCSILTYKLSPIGGGLNALYRINQNTGIHLID